MANLNPLYQGYLSGPFNAARSSSLEDFDADEFTQQQTENLINEDFSNGYVADRKSTDEILRNLNKVTNTAAAITQGEYKSLELSRMNQAVKPSNYFSTSERLSNGDFIKQQMSNPQTSKAIKESFAGKQSALLLTVRNSIGALSQGQLQAEDLESIFSRFGKVTVEVSNNSCDNQNNLPSNIQQSSAVLHFEDVVHAYFALISLHGLYLPSLNASLELRWKTDCPPKENQEKDKKDQKPLCLQHPKKPYELSQSQQENQETDENARPVQLSNSNNNNHNKIQSQNSYISKSQYLQGLQSAQYFQTDGNILRDSQANCQINISSLASSHQQHSQAIKQIPMQLLNNSNNTPQYSNNYNNSNGTFSNSIQQNNNNNNNNSNINNINSCNNGNSSNSNSNNNNNNNNNGGMKYTCRYEIQIPNDKDFQVARKIIGSRGENMKSIIRKCIEFGKKNGDQYANEEDHGVKLRLRGKGSGYKEGPEKQESSESLHLCVSSTYQEMYNAASFFVEELLQTIYDEYYKYCLQINLRRDKLVVKKQESTNGKTSSNTTTPCASGSTISQSQAISSQSQQFPSASLVPNLQKTNSNHCNLSCSQQTQQQQHQISNFSELQQQQQQIQQQQQSYSSSQSQQQFQTQFLPQQSSQSSQQPSNLQQTQQQSQGIYTHLQQQSSTFMDIADQPSNSIDDSQTRTTSATNNVRLSEKQILKFIEQRNRARKESKFSEADNIRNYLKNNGVVLMDEKGGRGKGQDVTTWKYYSQNQHGSISNSQQSQQQQQQQQYQPQQQQQQHTYIPKAMVL